MIQSEIYRVEDCIYYLESASSNEISLDVSLPSTFKLEFTMNSPSRSSTGGGQSAYIRLGETSSSGVWVGQGNSAGNHGIMVRPSTNKWCPTATVLNTDNNAVVTFDGSTLVYTCNNETVSTSTTNQSKMNAVIGTNNHRLKNVKLKPL